MRILKLTMLAGFCMLWLCGCSAHELEDRVFPQAMELHLKDGQLEGGFGEYLVQGASVAEICENYQMHLSDYLDLGHIKAIIFGKDLLSDKETARRVLLELEQMPIISRNSLVFTYEYQADESYLKALEKKEEHTGQYLCDLYRNNPYQAADAEMTLSELLSYI